jgi:hypothetical protein
MTNPKLSKTGHGFVLEIDGVQQILLGGQIHNSSSSDKKYIEKTFSKAAALNYNFLISPVSWQQFEPEEGNFDFSLLDHQLEVARAHRLRLVLIWFGSFKNAASTYTPTWVRSDTKKFPRALKNPDSKPTGTPTLSVFSKSLLEADKSAFQVLMAHLAEHDRQNTVVMVQVENEVGILGASRDYSLGANEAWSTQVPIEIEKHFGKSGTWAEVVGDQWQGHEVFMAWGFASFLNEIARAGKQIKDIPMYANAWLGPQEGQTEAGHWPSGGPSENVIDVWRLIAPALDFVSPDIYIRDALPVMETYSRADNALFIPESRHIAGNLFAALGNYGAIGYSMFGAEEGRIGNLMSESFGVLREATGIISNAQSTNTIRAVVLETDEPSALVEFDEVTVKAKNSLAGMKRFVEVAGVDLAIQDWAEQSELDDSPVFIPSNTDQRPFALIIREAVDRFLLIGKGINVDFEIPGFRVEIDIVEEGAFKNNEWISARNLNGDERLNFLPLRKISCARVSILRFPE